MIPTARRPAPARLATASALLLAAALLCAFPRMVPAATEGSVAAELLGPAGPERILQIAPEWKTVHDAYEPDASAVQRIREAADRAHGSLSIDVVFGSWCSDSREQVPRFIKVMEQLPPDSIPVRYVGVQKAREERGEIVTKLKLTAIPTIIVSRAGEEIGRIVETPRSSIEEDLAAILGR